MEWILAIYNVLAIVAMLHVLLDCRQPAKTVAWILVIYVVPVAGLLAYVLVGLNTRRKQIISRRSLDQLSRRQMDAFLEQQASRQQIELPTRHESLINFFARQDGALPMPSRDVQVYSSGYEFFPALLHHIAQARHHIHIDMYIVEDDALGRLLSDALIARSRQGVEVRLIYDDVGSWNTSRHFFERLRMEGIEVCAFMPVRLPVFTRSVNYRNHRKLIVIDGQTAFVGGMNFALRYVKGRTQPWRDTMLRLTGAAAMTVQRAFFIDWYFVDNTLINHKRYYPSVAEGSQPDSAAVILAQTVMHNPTSPMPVIEMGLLRVIMSARQYVYIQTPYFIPTESILSALTYAAAAGVDVRLMVPLSSDAPFTDWASRSYLRQVAQAGVQVELYRGGFLHSKLLVADDDVCTIGSSNIDFRSLGNNFELNTFIYDREVALQVRQLYLRDEQQSVFLARIRPRMRPRFAVRFIESVARLLAPLL